MTAATAHSRPFLDTIWARLLAAVVALGGIAMFLAFNWDRLVPAGGDTLAGNPQYQQCVAERMQAIANLEAQAGLSRHQVELHRARAAAFCQQEMAQ